MAQGALELLPGEQRQDPKLTEPGDVAERGWKPRTLEVTASPIPPLPGLVHPLTQPPTTHELGDLEETTQPL